MPFKSQAQRRKFAELLVEGKISNQTYEEWNRETGSKRLPERVRKKPAARKNPCTSAGVMVSIAATASVGWLGEQCGSRERQRDVA